MLKIKKLIIVLLLLIFVLIVFMNWLTIFVYIGSNYEINKHVRVFATKATFLYISTLDEEKVWSFIFKDLESSEIYEYIFLVNMGAVYGLNEFDEYLIEQLDLSKIKKMPLDKMTTIIKSIGRIGNEENIEFLKSYKEVSSDKTSYVINSFIETAIYYSGCSDCEYSFIINEQQKKIRDTIFESKNRKRTYEEMLIIDGISG